MSAEGAAPTTIGKRFHHPAAPFRLNLEQQHRRAKDLQRGLRAGDAAARDRFRRHHPRGRDLDAEGADRFTGLSEAQLVIARELGLPSWPKLKAHILAQQQARDAIRAGAAAPDRDAATLHIRCGFDIEPALREAGFCGDFLEYSNPLCQGPVVAEDDWLARRAAFVTQAYGAATGRSDGEILAGLQEAERRLCAAADYARVVLWLEHDSYDQLILARCLAQFAATPPRRLELISIDRYPGAARFIGLGQLPPEAIRLLWEVRTPVTPLQLQEGRAVWQMLRAADPTPLAAVARATFRELPHLAAAVRRHCQELPWCRDGLSLTERLILELVAERPRTVGEVFRDLMSEHEPLPWLGDGMFRFIVESMKRVAEPVFTGRFDDDERRWPRERLTITATGRAVLEGTVDWLSLHPPERWVGGVRIADAPSWRWDDRTETTMLR